MSNDVSGGFRGSHFPLPPWHAANMQIHYFKLIFKLVLDHISSPSPLRDLHWLKPLSFYTIKYHWWQFALEIQIDPLAVRLKLSRKKWYNNKLITFLPKNWNSWREFPYPCNCQTVTPTFLHNPIQCNIGNKTFVSKLWIYCL